MENQARWSSAMWSGLISFNQWWKKESDPRPKGLICNISTLTCRYIYYCSECFWGVLSPSGCDVWFPRPGHNHSNSKLSEVERQRPVRLYNIEKDPEERNDVSTQFPDIVNYLLSRLYHHQKSAVPVNYPDNDPKCDPERTGAWGPWEWRNNWKILFWSITSENKHTI